MKRLPLKHLVRINERALPETTDPLHAFRYLDIGAVGRGFLIEEPEETTFAAAPSRARRLVRQGDTILSTVRTYLRAVWPVEGSTDELVVSTGFAVLTPRSSIYPRYLGWLAQSDVVVDDIVARSVGVSYPAINAATIGEVVVPLPTLPVQREIADFLDAETARIDALITKKRQVLVHLDERETVAIEDMIVGAANGATPLRRLLAQPPQYGAIESGEDGEADWPRYIRITDLQSDGGLRSDGAKRLPPEQAAQFLLRDGDVLFARSGATSGKAFRYQASLGASCFAGYLIRFRFNAAVVMPEFIELWSRTEHYWGQVRSAAIQATIQNVNADRYMTLLVPDVAIADQMELVRELQTLRSRQAHVQARLGHQVELLRERRQALITAAVTGELPIPGVAA